MRRKQRLSYAAAALAALGATLAMAGGASASPDHALVAGPADRVLVEAQRQAPRRLWYRIHARFSGTSVRGSTTANGATQTIREANGYNLRANAATLVTANCSGPRLIAPGLSCAEARQRIRRSDRGARRRNLLRGLRETYSFNANMTGRIVGARITTTSEPLTVSSPTGEQVLCSPSSITITQLQAGPQRATGSVASRSASGRGGAGSGGGVFVEARRSGTSWRLLSRSASTCPTFRDNPPTFQVGGDSQISDFIWLPLDRDNLRFIDGKQVAEHLSFDRGGGFGRSFTMRRTISERGPRRDPSGQVVGTGQKSRSFTYTLIFRRCGNGGRVPSGC